MEIKTPAGMGTAVGNLIRQSVLVSVEDVKPIGFSFPEDYFNSSKIMDISDVIRALNVLEVDMSNVQLPYKVSITKSGTIRYGDLNSGLVRVKSNPDDVLVAVLGTQEISMNIIFDKVVGQRNADQNRAILQNSGYNKYASISVKARDVVCNFSVSSDVTGDRVLINCSDLMLLDKVISDLKQFFINLP